MIAPLLAVFVVGAHFDDGSIRGLSGSAELIKGSHPSIRMESEIVRIDGLPRGRVWAKFVFKNYGRATDVQMGFPGESGGDGASLESAMLGNFMSWVDGRRVRVKMLPSPKNSDEDWKLWYTKRVHFDAGQTHVIEDRYTGGGGDSSDGFRTFDYTLATGASWHGTIGRATVIMDFCGLSPYSPVRVGPGAKVTGSRAVWRWTDYKPGRDASVGVTWFPAFRAVYLNGQLAGVSDGLRHDAKDGPDSLVNATFLVEDRDVLFCVLRDHSVRAPARLAADWIGGGCKKLPNGRYRIAFGKKWADFTLGSRMLVSSSGKRTPMEFPAEEVSIKDLNHGRKPIQIIGLASVVQALGGKTKLDIPKRRLDLWLKP